MSIRVCRAEERDIPAIVALWKDFMDLLCRANSLYWEPTDDKDIITGYLNRALSDSAVLVAVAKKGECTVGFSLAYIEALPEWFRPQHIGMIRYLAVSENSRGKGIGIQMANFVFDWFRSVGIKRVELHVLKDLPASRFWEKLGFREFVDRRCLEI